LEKFCPGGDGFKTPPVAPGGGGGGGGLALSGSSMCRGKESMVPRGLLEVSSQKGYRLSLIPGPPSWSQTGNLC